MTSHSGLALSRREALGVVICLAFTAGLKSTNTSSALAESNMKLLQMERGDKTVVSFPLKKYGNPLSATHH
ncbi:hypothetical protein J3P89_15915 [Pseudomonas sp. Z1-14]|uniref:hypothetical protein n=1 Tax=Pseudomonas sp. Z1-14 TaxID=2817409 RepID=UPI003DA844F2